MSAVRMAALPAAPARWQVFRKHLLCDPAEGAMWAELEGVDEDGWGGGSLHLFRPIPLDCLWNPPHGRPDASPPRHQLLPWAGLPPSRTQCPLCSGTHRKA